MPLQLQQSDDQIVRLILDALVEEVNRCFSLASQDIVERAKNALKTALINTPEYQSLINGKLLTEFGLTDAQGKMASILNIWLNSFYIDIKSAYKYGNQVKAIMEIGAVPADYVDVLTVPEAQQITAKGQSLPWLDWILIQGDKTIINEYEVVAKASTNSRTGNSIMVKTGGRWRVPPEFAGTPQNNFVTRAIESIENNINDIIQEEVEKRW